jgi:hypothetical protein
MLGKIYFYGFFIISIILHTQLYSMENENQEASMETDQLTNLSDDFFPSESIDGLTYPLSPILLQPPLPCMADGARPLSPNLLPPILSTMETTEDPFYLTKMASDPDVSFLNNAIIFKRTEDLSSKTENKRILIYTSGYMEQGSFHSVKEIILTLTDPDGQQLLVQVECQDIIQSPYDISHEWTDAYRKKPYPPLTTIIRQVLACELVKILLLLYKPETIICLICRKPICQFDDGHMMLSFNTILLPCLGIAHLTCTPLQIHDGKIILNNYACPNCKMPILSDNDYVLALINHT